MATGIEQRCGDCRYQFKPYHDLAIGGCHLQSGAGFKPESYGGDNDPCNIDRFEQHGGMPPDGSEFIGPERSM